MTTNSSFPVTFGPKSYIDWWNEVVEPTSITEVVLLWAINGTARLVRSKLISTTLAQYAYHRCVGDRYVHASIVDGDVLIWNNSPHTTMLSMVGPHRYPISDPGTPAKVAEMVRLLAVPEAFTTGSGTIYGRVYGPDIGPDSQIMFTS